MSRTWTDGAIAWLMNKCKTTFLPKNQFYDGYLGWGGRNIAGDISPIDAAMSSLHNANRAELCKAEGITVEYSADGGVTWKDYGLTDDEKRRLFSVCGHDILYSPGVENNRSTDVCLRITMNASKMGIYTSLKKVLVNFSRQGASNCTVFVERSFKGSESTWHGLFTQSVSGWSGWNSLSIQCAFGGSSGQTQNTANIRMTFMLATINEKYSSNPCVKNVLLFGTKCWAAPSNMARIGHLYTWDMEGNATFPSKINASSFNGHTIRADVPQDAKFTDTTYTLVTDSVNGLMSSSDKTKLDAFENADQYAKVSTVIGTPRVFQNVSVTTSLWELDNDTNYTSWPYCANVALEGVTKDMYPQIAFNPNDDKLYNFSPICMAYDGGVQIYSETIPAGAVTLLSIVCFSF